MRFLTSGQACNALGISLARLNAAVHSGHAGRISFVGERRAFTPANLRLLARHFGKPIPAEGLVDMDPQQLEQLHLENTSDD